MKDKASVRFLFKDKKAANFVYRAPKGNCEAQNATLGMKFAQKHVILDDAWLFGGTPWTRFKFRMKHPIVYSKRGLKKIYRRIKRLFVKERTIQCLWARDGKSKEEMLKLYPEKNNHAGRNSMR